MNRCDACKYFHQMNPVGGQCRFDPPRTLATFMQPAANEEPQIYQQGYFPVMPVDAWCGKWEQGIAIANQMPPASIVRS